jgi:hypothetical protein
MHPGILPLYILFTNNQDSQPTTRDYTSALQTDVIPLSPSIPVSNIEKRATKTGNAFLSKTFQKYLPSPRKNLFQSTYTVWQTDRPSTVQVSKS